ncbi:hypothetical protein BJ944DRAFT_270283 [Cunninghamella echinulata]|nr:hypothetical protein BJ944DRAFT_270283 [Cunninghamella echinulata]
MVDFLTSPILFPSDMDCPKLSCEPTYKLPEAVDWEEFEYTNLQHMNNSSNSNQMIQQHYYSQLFSTLLLNDNNQKELNPSFIYNDNDDDDDKHLLLKKNDVGDALRDALNLVENDMHQNGIIDKLYYHHYSHSDDWREDLLDSSPPDLVYSLCSSTSTSFIHDDDDDDVSSSTFTSNNNISDPIIISNSITTMPLFIQEDPIINKKSLKGWVKKSMKQAVQTMSSQSRKLYHWMKH